VLDTDRRSTLIEIFKDETADPDPGHFDIGHDVAGAYALDSLASIELLALPEKSRDCCGSVIARQPRAVTASAG